MTTAKDTLLLGTRKGLVVFRNQSEKWTLDTTHFLGIPVSYACADPRNGTWWAGLDHGHWGCKLHRSKDQGQTWEEVAAPVYPEGSEIKPGLAATLRYIWCIAPGPASHPDRLYIGTEPGGLFVSEDGGDSFSLVQSLWDLPGRQEKWFGAGRDYPGIHSILVDPANPAHLFVGVSVAGVFETRDGGQTWKSRYKGMKATYLPDEDAEIGQDPHLLVAHPRNFDHLWTQHHCGIFRSTDGGEHWTQVSDQNGGPAHFGFAIALDEEDVQTAWVVPIRSDEVRVAREGQIVTCFTRDGGQSWSTLAEGLPGENAFDITFRHAFDLSGETLCFGTTTGNVFLSSDKGQHWQVLSNYLPLVYSVRFA